MKSLYFRMFLKGAYFITLNKQPIMSKDMSRQTSEITQGIQN